MVIHVAYLQPCCLYLVSWGNLIRRLWFPFRPGAKGIVDLRIDEDGEITILRHSNCINLVVSRLLEVP